MDVSVVIPTRARSNLLLLSLRSALRQQQVNAEVLVVQDGTDPETERLIERCGDPRVRLLRNPGPAGVSCARNAGIDAAEGQWIAFLDDDDLWAPDKLAMQLAAAKETRAGWVYAGDVSVDEVLNVRAGAPPPAPETLITELHRYNSVPAGASNVLVRRDVLDSAGRFDPGLRTSEDWDLWLRLAGTGLPAFVPRPLVALRIHASMASRAIDQMLADIQIIARRHGIRVDRARHERWAAWMYLEDRRAGRALRHYVRAAAAGDILSLGRAACALVFPGLALRGRDRPCDDWCREAQKWLDALCAEVAVERVAAGQNGRF